MSDIMTVRDIETITTEIKTIESQVAKAAIYGCIEIGKRLVEAKEMVGHGNWGKYLEEKVRYSQQWATNLMNLYREYGSTQESLFENFANSQSFGKIDVTKHILLLGVPAEEREAFAAEHDAENISTRELQAAIRERDANLQAANEQAARAERAEAEVEKLNAAVLQQVDMLEAKDTEADQLRAQAKTAQKQQADAEQKVQQLNDKLKKAKDSERAAKEALKAAKEHPEIPESMMEAMRQQVAADAAAKATADLQKQLAEAQEQAAKAVKERQAAEEKVAAAQKAVQLANPDAAVFKLLFTQVQNDFIKLKRTLLNVQQNDPATGQKLRAAMVTLLDKLKSDLAG